MTRIEQFAKELKDKGYLLTESKDPRYKNYCIYRVTKVITRGLVIRVEYDFEVKIHSNFFGKHFSSQTNCKYTKRDYHLTWNFYNKNENQVFSVTTKQAFEKAKSVCDSVNSIVSNFITSNISYET
jgi:hypothetical protein